MLRRNFYPLILGLLLFVGSFSEADAQNYQRDVTFIIDGSNSMWGQIDGINKIVILRKAFEKYQSLIPKKQALSLIVYGHRSKDGCNDVQTEFKNKSEIDKKLFLNKINSINPKGNTPIAKAINLALEQIKSPKKYQNDIVLITDGTDNCGGKIKKLTQKIKPEFPNTKIHVITFDVNEKYLEQFEYLSKQTKGKFYKTQNKKTFEQALGNILTNLYQKDQKLFKPLEVDEENFYKQRQIRLNAVVAENTPTLQKGVKWEIIKEQLDGQYARQVFRKYDESDILVGGLNNGKYIAIAYYGYARAQAQFEIKKQTQFDTQNITVNLNAGGLRVKAFIAGSKTPIEKELSIILKEKNQQQREYLLDSINDNTFYRLNAGAYNILSNYGDVNSQIKGEILIKPGKLTEAVINFRAGKLIFRLVNEKLDKQQIQEVYWKFFDQAGTLILATDSVSPSHIFNSGVYDLEVTYQGKNYRSTFNVETGKNKIVEVLIR